MITQNGIFQSEKIKCDYMIGELEAFKAYNCRDMEYKNVKFYLILITQYKSNDKYMIPLVEKYYCLTYEDILIQLEEIKNREI